MPLGHVGVNVADLAAAKAYYDAVMPLLGYEEFFSREDEFSYRPVDGKVGSYLFFYPSLEPAEFSRHRTGLQHLAFIVKTHSAVNAVHGHVLAAGGEVLHAPKEWPEYHDGYYATFWLDPFGIMLEAVCHRDESAL